MKINKTNKNSLRRTRIRRRLERKQVSFLLNRKTTDEISRYEMGRYLPSLKTALKLEVIYGMPIRLMFPSLFEQLKNEIEEKRKGRPKLFPDPGFVMTNPEQLIQEEFCFYGNLLSERIPNELELRVLDKHIINLMNTSSLYRRTHNPNSQSKSI